MTTSNLIKHLLSTPDKNIDRYHGLSAAQVNLAFGIDVTGLRGSRVVNRDTTTIEITHDSFLGRYKATVWH